MNKTMTDNYATLVFDTKGTDAAWDYTQECTHCTHSCIVSEAFEMHPSLLLALQPRHPSLHVCSAALVVCFARHFAAVLIIEKLWVVASACILHPSPTSWSDSGKHLQLSACRVSKRFTKLSFVFSKNWFFDDFRWYVNIWKNYFSSISIFSQKKTFS